MHAADHRAAIVEEGGRVASTPIEALDAPVTACPGWTVERLVGHLGRIHRWAAAFVASGPGSDEQVSAGPRPPAGAEVLGWYREALDELLAELDRHDPSDPARSFAGPADTAFWFRRQAHEISVHRWDLQDAARPGGATPIDPVLAADGIDEWASFFVPRFLEVGGGPPAELVGATVHIHCTDDDLAQGTGEWLLRLVDGGSEVERAHAKGDAALRGPASDLVLAVWHRVPLDRIDVVGDAERARAVLDTVHVT